MELREKEWRASASYAAATAASYRPYHERVIVDRVPAHAPYVYQSGPWVPPHARLSGSPYRWSPTRTASPTKADDSLAKEKK